ncbi:MAG: Trp biosynthesis-associated membrane protein, partial [Actinoplanes sp.]
MSRRPYALTLLACLAGAALSAYAATRVWSVQVVTRPALSDLRTERTGADVEPWLLGLALVALAGTGALLATHGRVRRGLGALLTLTGAGVVAGAIAGRAGLDAGSASPVWPVACALGGVII